MIQSQKSYKSLLKQLFVVSTLVFFCTSTFAQTIPYSKGRIVISSDGNEHDHDDWAATPFSLALLAAKGLQDKLTVYTFSDHIWGSNFDKPDAKKQMLKSALEGQKKFGFDQTLFIEAVEDPVASFSAITAEINRSSAENPLTIIAAGPMHVVGVAISKAKSEKLKHVLLISHSPWNNQHSDHPTNVNEHHTGWTWTEIEAEFTPKGLTCNYIANQNGGKDYKGMHAPIEDFDWIKTSPARDKAPYKKGSWNWLYVRQKTCIKKNKFDPSDAGMIIYLLTGIEKTNPSDAKDIMENPVIK